jgi:hypothetical protein
VTPPGPRPSVPIGPTLTTDQRRALEQRWEEALRREQELREGYDRFRRESPRRLTPEELNHIRALAADIPSLWHAAETPAADRKEIVRALVERVTVTVARDTESVLVHIRWRGGTTTEHAVRRPIRHDERLADFTRMRRLVEAAVAAGQTSRQIAECLNQEGFRPPSNRADRFTPERARDLVYRLGLSPRRRPAESLAVDEWWLRDLADALGVGSNRFREWVRRGYVHVRRVGRRKHLVIWADAEERERLSRLRDAFRPGRTSAYPVELTRPKARPDQRSEALGAQDAGLDPSRIHGPIVGFRRDGTPRARLERCLERLPSGGREPWRPEQTGTRRGSSTVRPWCGERCGAVSSEGGAHRNRERLTTARGGDLQMSDV